MTGRAFRILILEHDPTDAQMIEGQLRKLGLTISTKRVERKEFFLKALEDFRPDLIIADYAIPKFDMLAALKQAGIDQPGVPWVILSSAGSEEVAVSCLKAGAADYLVKKNVARLVPAVKTLLEKKTAAEAQASRSQKRPGAGGDIDPGLMPLVNSLIASTPDLIAFVDIDGKRLYNNPAYGGVLEDPDILQGTDSFLDVHADDREQVKRVFLNSLRTGTGRRIEYRLLDIHGNTRTIESQGTILRDPDGKIRCLGVISRDVSERKRADIAFQGLVAGTASKTGTEFFTALTRHLASTLNVRFALVSEFAGGSRVRALAYWANGQWVPSFEYDVKGTTCEKVVTDGKMAYYPDHVQTLFPGGRSLGAATATCYLGMPFFDSAGDLMGHLFIMNDRPLTDYERAVSIMGIFAARAAMELERKRTLDRIQRSEATLRSILDSLNDGVIMTDLVDVITYASPRMTTLVGYASTEMIGKPVSPLLFSKDEWVQLRERNRRHARGAPDQSPAMLRRKDGGFVEIALSVLPSRDQLGEVVGMLVLIVERRRAS